jgi:hypothetical protein
VAYPFPTLTKSGKVIFALGVATGTRSQHPEEIPGFVPWQRRSLFVVDPAWLCETRQAADFSAGLDDWSVFGSKGVELQPDREKSGANVLAIRKADAAWPAGAVWNFPVGAKGVLRLELMLRSGFGGNLIGLTDHFSVPWDEEDEFHNAFNLPIDSEGHLLPKAKLAPGRWYRLELNWDTSHRQCKVLLDGKRVGTIQDNRRSKGVNYLRLRSMSTGPDGGLLLGRVEVDVSASWVAK